MVEYGRMKPNYLVIPALVILVSLAGSALTSPELGGWYKSLRLPPIAPPGGAIGAVWTTIFILSVIALLLVWNGMPRNRLFPRIIFWFTLNGVLNVGWSWVFFNRHWIGLAVSVAVGLELTVLALILLLWRPLRPAALLLLPYAAWVLFAIYLNYTIWALNA